MTDGPDDAEGADRITRLECILLLYVERFGLLPEARAYFRDHDPRTQSSIEGEGPDDAPKGMN